MWNSPFRWWFVGIGVFMLFSYGLSGYTRFFTDEGYGIKTAVIEYTDEGAEIIFDLPPDLEHSRVEILEMLQIETNGKGVIGFSFPNANMYRFVLPGQKTMNRIANRVTKKVLDMPFHKERTLDMIKYKGYMSKKGKAIIYSGTEIEWEKPPYMIVAMTKGKNKSFKMSSAPIRYRVVDPKDLGRIVPEK